MKYPITALLIVVSLILMSAKSAPSSLPADFNDLTSAEQIEIVRSLQALIEDKYVLEKESHLLVAGLEYGIESGVFGESRSPEAFANVANQLLQKAFPDRHLGVLLPARYQEMVEMFGGSDEEVSDQPESHDGGGHKAAPEQHAAPQPHAAPQKSTAQNGLGEDREAEGRTALRNLAGITRVAEINRDGLNQIGYIAFERLIYSDAAVSILSNIFATFSESDRMVIDLRECGGGDADIVKFISNYFFDEPTHLVSTQTRNGPVQERWTKTNALSDVFSKKKLDILISESTFSAAESFSFGMQRTGRARLLGKATGGGGHMNDFFALPNGFGASISVGRTFDPRTGEGWQTRGVEPEIIFERDHTLSETMKLITAESHKLETFSPDQLDVYQTLQDYTHAWYNSESAEMAGLISAEYLATYHAGQTVETRNFDQQISSTQNGVGQRIQLYHNRIIRNIDLSGELAEADLILRDTIHRIRLQKSGEEWKILADEYKDKPMHG